MFATLLIITTACTGLGAQDVVDRRAAAIPVRKIVAADSCVVIGDGMGGRPEGLFGALLAVPAGDGTVNILNSGTGEFSVTIAAVDL